MKPGGPRYKHAGAGGGRFKPPAPVYRSCARCGRKHRVRPDGSSKTAIVFKKGEEILSLDGTQIWLLADSLICSTYCQPR